VAGLPYRLRETRAITVARTLAAEHPQSWLALETREDNVAAVLQALPDLRQPPGVHVVSLTCRTLLQYEYVLRELGADLVIASPLQLPALVAMLRRQAGAPGHGNPPPGPPVVRPARTDSVHLTETERKVIDVRTPD
jgi:hypothetical protein